MGEFDFTRLRVLIVDDEPFMRKLLTRVLDELEIGKITEATDGSEALTTFSNARNDFDLIICDLEMPNMDGYEFVRRLRENKSLPNSNIPILILSGLSEEGNIRSAVKAGIHGYLVKPISKDALEKRIVAAVKSQLIDPDTFK